MSARRGLLKRGTPPPPFFYPTNRCNGFESRLGRAARTLRDVGHFEPTRSLRPRQDHEYSFSSWLSLQRTAEAAQAAASRREREAAAQLVGSQLSSRERGYRYAESLPAPKRRPRQREILHTVRTLYAQGLGEADLALA